jgi:peptide/nickel transport system substrate-binding protein
MPSLEVGFVVFNLQNKNFAQKALREAVARAVNKKAFLDLAYGYAKEINQFVPSGVFGYNPEIETLQYEPDVSTELIDKMVSGFEKLQLDFYFPQNLRLLGQYFSEQLAPVGINLRLFPLTDQQLQEKLAEGTLGFYYLGWRHDTGDALPFLKAVLHSRKREGYGLYNGSAYQNDEVDRLIEKSETNFNESERLSDLQTVMRMAVQEDLIGVPLFESMSIFAFRPGLEYQPRVDSLVLPSDISNSSQ